MTPFLQLRRWARNAPPPERLVTAGLAVVIFALLGWAMVPVRGRAGVGTAALGGLSGTPGPGAASGTSPTNGATPSASGAAPTGGSNGGTPVGGPTALGSGTPTPTGSGPSAGQGSAGQGSANQPTAGAPIPGQPNAGTGTCGPLTNTDQGVSATQINIDVDVANLGGQAGNSLVGLPSAQQEEATYQAAIDAVNRGGGVRCRKLVAKYYAVNPLDQSSLEAACLQIVADHPFALLDEGLSSPAGSPTPRDCPPSYQVPEFGTQPLSQAEHDRFAPYLFSDGGTAEGVVHDWVLAAHQLGWFAGAKKIGLLEQDCVPDINHLVLSDLAKIGVSASETTTFDFGCPNAIPPPNQVEQAVLQFKTAGVTNVMDDGGVYENYFSKAAKAQDYKPKYSVGDQGTIALWDNPNFGPDPQNFSGALAITPTQYGAENTPGTVFNPQTSTCDKAMAAKGLPSAERSPDGLGGVACVAVNMFATAADRAPVLRRTDLATGLRLTGHLDFSFPIGPANLAAAQGLHGGGYWRADTWVTACSCFRVSDATFSPSFP